MNTQPDFFKESLLLIDRTDMEVNAVKDLLIKLFESIGQFHFSFQLNDFIRKAIQCRRTETVKHVIQCLCDYSYQINYDPNQINWTDCFKFISQLNDIKTCTDSVIKMIDKKIYLPDATMNFIVENLVEKRNYESCFKILARLHDHARIAKLNSKSILKNFLIFDQSEHAFQFLQLLPLDVTATLYTWEDYIQYCCSKDKVKEAREFMKIFFTKTLPNNFNEIAAIYSYFLSSLCRGESRKDIIIGTIDDIVYFKLKVKPAVLKDCLLKLLDEKIDQKQFYTKVDLVKFNLESREFSALLSRLIQLKRKVEVMALIDMIVNENGFSFKLADLNLSSQEMKYVLAAQSTSIRRLLDEKDHMEAQDDDTKSMISFKSDITSIIDRLTFQDPDEDLEMSFDKISTLSGK